MNHAIEQQIKDNTLYVEVEPQPDEDKDGVIFKPDSLCYVDVHGKIICDITPPILVGDTVYQGEEWVDEDVEGRDCSYTSKPLLASEIVAKYYHRREPTDMTAKEFFEETEPPKTMPIELADKTFKVVGIEVELCGWCEDCKVWVEGEEDKEQKWFWKYSLEEL